MTYAIYARYSPRPGTREANEPTIELQVESGRRYADHNELGDLVDVYADRSVSARKRYFRKRSAGKAVWEAVKAHQVQHVVAMRLDRLFRNAIDGRTCVDAFTKAGAAFHLAADGGTFETVSAMGCFNFQMRLCVLEYEAALTAERTQSAMRSYQANGRRMTRPDNVPYGYELNHRGPVNEEGIPRLVQPNVAEQGKIRLMRRWQKGGLSYGQIAQRLNAEGLFNRSGRRWRDYQIGRVLRSDLARRQNGQQAR